MYPKNLCNTAEKKYSEAEDEGEAETDNGDDVENVCAAHLRHVDQDNHYYCAVLGNDGWAVV